MKNRFLIAVIFATALVLQSRADTWSFWYSGAGVSADGILTTGGYDASFGGYVITGISGERNGVMIDALVNNPNSPQPAYLGNIVFDNLLLVSTGVDYNGLFYSAGGTNYNAYLNTDNKYYDLTQAQAAAGSLGIQITAGGLQAIPDGGATITLLGMGLLLIPLIPGRRARRKIA